MIFFKKRVLFVFFQNRPIGTALRRKRDTIL